MLQNHPKTPELKVRKIMGRTYLNENRLEEALQIFSGILRDYPADFEALVVLGNLYLAAGDGATAASLYKQALALDPTNTGLRKQILLAAEEAGPGPGEPLPTDPAAVARLLQRLMGRSEDVAEADLWKAASLLEEIVHSEHPAEEVQRRMDEINDLLPALIELNIRQARADGRPDLEEGLRNLRINVELQLSGQPPRPLAEVSPAASPALGWRVLLLGPETPLTSRRMKLVKGTLEARGVEVVEAAEYRQGSQPAPDAAIISNPHIRPALLESMVALTAAKVPLILDLDTDYERMPVFHPSYSAVGLGMPSRGRAYAAALALATHITVASEEHAASLRSGGYAVTFAPDGWSARNPLWAKETPERTAVRIGWVSGPGQLEDLAAVRRAIVRVMREFPDTQMAVIGDLQAYRLFESLPENRRFFLPATGPDEYPYLLSQLDMLLVPLRNHPYNHTLSDGVLVEACAKGLPWIASPIPSFQRWEAGGLFADTVDEWHLQLRQLVMDAETRALLTESGRKAARDREQDQIASVWTGILHNLLAPAPVDLQLPLPDLL